MADIEPKTKNSNGDNGGTHQGPAVWARVKAQLKKQVPADIYTNWISDLKFVAEVDGAVLIAARKQYTFDRVNADHGQLIQRTWKRCDPQARLARLACWATAGSDLHNLVQDPWAEEAAKNAAEKTADPSGAASGQPATQPAPSLSFDTLVVGPSNTVAVETAKMIASGRQIPGGTTVLISGPQGVGKTHTLRALEQFAASRANPPRVVYMTAEEFMVAFVDGARMGDTSALKARVRECDIIMIDDLQTLAGKRKTDIEFFSTLRAVTGKGGIAVLTADAVSSELSGLSPQIRNELKGAVKIEVGMPDKDMRREILERQAAAIAASSEKFVLTSDMKARILQRVRGPGRSLCGILWSLHIETRFGELSPTLDMLDDIIRRQEGDLKPATLETVKRAACEVFKVSKADLESTSKRQCVTHPRHIAIYVARMKTDKSYPQIGRAFGGRDHATCIYSFRKISKLISQRADVEADVKRVLDALYEILGQH